MTAWPRCSPPAVSGAQLLHRSFSSALPYLVDGRAVVTMLRPPAGPGGHRGPALQPLDTGEGIVPVDRLNRLRRPSYASSQQGRPAGISRR